MISINFERAADIAHARRRNARAEEFKPLDDLIAKQIPGIDVEAVEANRAAIRARYDALQGEIDACKSVEALKSIIDREGW